MFLKCCPAFWFRSHLKISQCFYYKLLFWGFTIAIKTCSWHVYTHANFLVKEAEFKCQVSKIGYKENDKELDSEMNAKYLGLSI